MIFQIKNDSDDVGLLKVVECLGNKWSPESYGDIIEDEIQFYQ
jgi:hypothetical protein